MKIVTTIATIVILGAVTIGFFLLEPPFENYSGSEPPRHPLASPTITQGIVGSDTICGGTETCKTYSNGEYGFALTYPSEFTIHARSSTDRSSDIVLQFVSATSSIPLTLDVTDLARYLPLTNTPDLPSYIRSLHSLSGFKQAAIGGKDVYEYAICGWAACSLEVLFIHNQKEYDFSIDTYRSDGSQTGNDSVSLENAPVPLQQIVESLLFTPV